MLRRIKSEMRFILTSKSWSFAINRAATVAEVVVVVADQAEVAIVTITVAVVVIVITAVIWDRVQCIMAVAAAAGVATTTGTIVEILTCQTYNR